MKQTKEKTLVVIYNKFKHTLKRTNELNKTSSKIQKKKILGAKHINELRINTMCIRTKPTIF